MTRSGRTASTSTGPVKRRATARPTLSWELGARTRTGRGSSGTRGNEFVLCARGHNDRSLVEFATFRFSNFAVFVPHDSSEAYRGKTALMIAASMPTPDLDVVKSLLGIPEIEVNALDGLRIVLFFGVGDPGFE